MFKSTTIASRKRRWGESGFIYFIQVAGGGPVKIGWTITPEKRLAEIQVACPYSLLLLGAIAGSQQDERRWHKWFAQFRLRGEWFAPSPELAGFIEFVLGQITPSEFLYRNPNIAELFDAEGLRLDLALDPAGSLWCWLGGIVRSSDDPEPLSA